MSLNFATRFYAQQYIYRLEHRVNSVQHYQNVLLICFQAIQIRDYIRIIFDLVSNHDK